MLLNTFDLCFVLFQNENTPWHTTYGNAVTETARVRMRKKHEKKDMKKKEEEKKEEVNREKKAQTYIDANAIAAPLLLILKTKDTLDASKMAEREKSGGISSAGLKAMVTVLGGQAGSKTKQVSVIKCQQGTP